MSPEAKRIKREIKGIATRFAKASKRFAKTSVETTIYEDGFSFEQYDVTKRDEGDWELSKISGNDRDIITTGSVGETISSLVSIIVKNKVLEELGRESLPKSRKLDKVATDAVSLVHQV